MQNNVELIENEFPNSNVTSKDNIVKTHFEKLDAGDIITLSRLVENPEIIDVNVKRSGKGLTVIFTF